MNRRRWLPSIPLTVGVVAFWLLMVSEINAALGLAQVRRLDAIVARRALVAERNMTALRGLAGDIGAPVPGMTLKLVPVDGKTEVRYRGPNVTPGYWRTDAATRDAFDEEGYLCTGDAVLWIDPGNIHRGLKFDGRIAEDFKLSTGTFVSVGPLRAKVIVAGAPYVQDVVLTGLNMKEVGALVFPAPACREVSGLGADASMADVLASSPVRQRIQAIIDELARESTGSASRIARALVLAEPPSPVLGEITDKGSVNQRAVLKHRDALVNALHDGSAPGIFTPQT